MRQLRFYTNPRNGREEHPDWKEWRIQSDEKDVHQMFDLIQSVWKDPFEEDEICNLATGVKASPQVKEYLLSAHAKGLK